MTLARLLSLLAPPLCWGCGGGAAPGAALCRPCRSTLRWLDPQAVHLGGLAAWAPVAYEGPARAIVGGLKYRGATALADQMASFMLARAPPGLTDNCTLVPVPLHAARLRRRGFNQAERLAAAMAARSRLPLSTPLTRSGAPGAQVGRGRGDRLAATRGSISASTPVPERALLVDDVVTTGATLAACAAALREAGTRHVAAIAYARALGR
jgi:predicted amidophosphoribosyltransferase